jgi:hypothetical protein
MKSYLKVFCQAQMAHTCNPNYSGGRDQEDHRFKARMGKSLIRSYLEKPFTKIELVRWLKVKTLSSSPSTVRKKSFLFILRSMKYL